DGDHSGAIGVLHDRAIDRQGWRIGERACLEAEEIEVLLPALHSPGTCVVHGRMEATQFVEIMPGAQQEYPAVPVERAAIDETLRRVHVGLLYELVDGAKILAPVECRTGLDVAVSRLRPGRLDAEGH